MIRTSFQHLRQERFEPTLHDMASGDLEALGRDLLSGSFRPLPEVDADGVLVGVRMWRVRNGMVEQILLRRTGAAQAVRAFAQFSYSRPFDHGPVTEIRSGHPVNAHALAARHRQELAGKPMIHQEDPT